MIIIYQTDEAEIKPKAHSQRVGGSWEPDRNANWQMDRRGRGERDGYPEYPTT